MTPAKRIDIIMINSRSAIKNERVTYMAKVIIKKYAHNGKVKSIRKYNEEIYQRELEKINWWKENFKNFQPDYTIEVADIPDDQLEPAKDTFKFVDATGPVMDDRLGKILEEGFRESEKTNF